MQYLSGIRQSKLYHLSMKSGRVHHGVSKQHLQAYLDEFVFRFNRRFYPMTAFASILGIGANVAGPTYRDLYDGEWDHHTQSSKSNLP